MVKMIAIPIVCIIMATIVNAIPINNTTDNNHDEPPQMEATTGKPSDWDWHPMVTTNQPEQPATTNSNRGARKLEEEAKNVASDGFESFFNFAAKKGDDEIDKKFLDEVETIIKCHARKNRQLDQEAVIKAAHALIQTIRTTAEPIE